MTSVVVFLHGHGDTPDEYLRLAPQLLPEGSVLVAPRGPCVLSDGTAAWFGSDPDGGADPAQLAAGLDAVSAAIADAVAAHDTSPEHVVLAGFSQGGAMALAWSLRRGALGRGTTPRVAAVLCVAGWLPDAEGLDLDLASPVDVPFLVAHGNDDEAVPAPMGRSVVRVLERNGWTVSFVDGDHGHELAPFAPRIRTWLDALD
jgi:phospholipase/carboxylesterase